MIKAEVNVTGTIKKSAVVRTDKQGKPYIGFVLTVNLQNSQGETKPVDIYVNVPNGQQSELSQYIEGSRIAVSGMMDVHRKDDDIVLFLEANLLSQDEVGELDSIAGTMSFRGHLRNEKVYEERTTKKGNPFLLFSAYSSEKVGEEFVSTWVNFMRFPAKDAGIETIKPDWMTAEAHVEIKGTFELQVFKGRLSIGSMVKEMNLYVKPENVQQ
jgi:primosomal replication protein N